MPAKPNHKELVQLRRELDQALRKQNAETEIAVRVRIIQSVMKLEEINKLLEMNRQELTRITRRQAVWSRVKRETDAQLVVMKKANSDIEIMKRKLNALSK